jgi:hypothetical protein
MAIFTLNYINQLVPKAQNRVRSPYHMLKEKTPYRARGAEEYLHKDHERQLRHVRKQAKHLGFDLVPQPTN